MMVIIVAVLSGCVATNAELRQRPPTFDLASPKSAKDVATCVADAWENRLLDVRMRPIKDGYSVAWVSASNRGITTSLTALLVDVVEVESGSRSRYFRGNVIGFTDDMRCAMFPLLQELRTEESPFADLPEKRRTLYSLTRDEMTNCQWLKPLLVAQIEFTQWTPDGHLRHASFAGLRSDKDPRSIVRELILS
jgi:hypothetical protein